MMNGAKDGVRWMVTFWHPDGDRTTEPNFPKVSFWHPDKRTSRMAAARVLWELRERGDTRDWAAVGYPDPFAVGQFGYISASWTLRRSDLESDGNGGVKIKSVAGAWKGRVDADEMKRALADARAEGSRDWRGE